eukprot:2919691-Amphidinium_carterae.1
MTTVHATTATQLTVDGPSRGGKAVMLANHHKYCTPYCTSGIPMWWSTELSCCFPCFISVALRSIEDCGTSFTSLGVDSVVANTT